MDEMNELTPLDYDQAVALLPAEDKIMAVVQMGEPLETEDFRATALVGQHFTRDEVLEILRDFTAFATSQFPPELHLGIVVVAPDRVPLFIETRPGEDELTLPVDLTL